MTNTSIKISKSIANLVEIDDDRITIAGVSGWYVDHTSKIAKAQVSLTESQKAYGPVICITDDCDEKFYIYRGRIVERTSDVYTQYNGYENLSMALSAIDRKLNHTN